MTDVDAMPQRLRAEPSLASRRCAEPGPELLSSARADASVAMDVGIAIDIMVDPGSANSADFVGHDHRSPGWPGRTGG